MQFSTYHSVKLMAAQHVKAFLRNKRIKNDERDAEAIYTCGIQPDTKFVRIKTEESANSISRS